MGLTIVMFALGLGNLPGLAAGHVHGGFGHHVDFGSHGVHVGPGAAPHGVHVTDAGPGHGLAGESISPLNMATILAFVTWFSGSGYILTGVIGLGTLVACALAGSVGLIGAGIVFFILVRVLLPGQTPYLRAEDFEMEGTIGRLAVAIRAGGTGELVFSKGGARHVVGACTVDGEALNQGAEVVVVRQERGIAYVQSFEEFFEDSGANHAPDA